jgi:hypothetical protein
MQRLAHSRCFVYFTAAIVSVLLSYWIGSHHVVLNPDAICYLQSAELVPQGLSAVMALCDQSTWPFYQVLIAGLVAMTKCSYEHAAFMLNGLFSLFTVLIFIRIVALFTDNKRLLWLAAVVILFAHELNVFKQDIIRDHGFWCFYLLSIFFLLRFFQQKEWLAALGWSGSLVLATLFRIEGAIFLAFIPMLTWFEWKQPWFARLKAFVQLNLPMLLVAGLVLLVAIMHPEVSLGRLAELRSHFQLSNFYTDVIQHYIALADELGRSVLGRSENDKYLVYFFTLVVWYISIVISGLSLIYAVLFGYAVVKKSFKAECNAKLVLWGYIALNVLLTFIFLVQNQFVSKRYIIALALTLMLWVPFALNDLIAQWSKRRWPLVLAIIFISISGVSSVYHLGGSKQYIRAAGDWLDQNVAQTAKIYSNDYQVMYYSQHFGNQIFAKQREYADLHGLQGGQWKQYDYLAIRLNKKSLITEAKLLHELDSLPVVVFTGKHSEDQIRIYRRSQ